MCKKQNNVLALQINIFNEPLKLKQYGELTPYPIRG
jgi:hypothetical protein